VHGPIGLVGDDHDDETKAERSVEQPGPTVVSQCDVLSVGGPQITGTTAPYARARGHRAAPAAAAAAAAAPALSDCVVLGPLLRGATGDARCVEFTTARNESVPIQLAQCRFPGLASPFPTLK